MLCKPRHTDQTGENETSVETKQFQGGLLVF